MTLSTTLIVKDPVSAEALFRFGQSLLSSNPEEQQWVHIPPMTEHYYHEAYTSPPEPNGQWKNVIGQGLPAIFYVEYGADGPLVLDQYERNDDDVRHRSGCLKVWLDTAYGYQGPLGGDCSDLHAWILLMLCGWLERRGAKFEWQHESTGDWYDNVTDLTILGDPTKGQLPHVG